MVCKKRESDKNGHNLKEDVQRRNAYDSHVDVGFYLEKF
jgi:hypothetical protein